MRQYFGAPIVRCFAVNAPAEWHPCSDTVHVAEPAVGAILTPRRHAQAAIAYRLAATGLDRRSHSEKSPYPCGVAVCEPKSKSSERWTRSA